LTAPTANSITIAGTPLLSGTFAFGLQAACTNGTAVQSYTIPVGIGCGAGNRTLISAIQGSGNTALLPNNTIVEVEGIVVGDFQNSGQLRGFFFQDPAAEADGNPATSDGIFVFEGNTSLLNVNLGDRVRVKGSVLEFNSGSGATLTELTSLTRSAPAARAPSIPSR
jgi:predicted extracellular nuclease